MPPKNKIFALLSRVPVWAYIVAGIVLAGIGGVVVWHLNTNTPTQPTTQAPQTSADKPAASGNKTTPSTPAAQPATTPTQTPTAQKPGTPAVPQNSSGGQTGGGQSGQTGGNTGGGGTSGGNSGGGSTGCAGTAGAPGGTDSWGGCWPGTANTGVPAGTNLQRVPQDVTSGAGWAWNGTDQIIYITGNSAVVSGLNVSGGIIATGTGVTVKNSKATFIYTSGAARSAANPRLTIQDSEVNCGNAGGTTAIGDMNFTVVRVNIHGCENGFDVDSDASITDSYIHDLYNSTVGDPHTDGLQSAVGSRLAITHNVFYGFTTGCAYPNNGSCNGTSAININNLPSGPSSTNTTVSKNLLAGGAFALYCPVVATSNFQVTNNHFSRVYSPNVGEYGPSSDCAGEIQSGNVIHETGQAITLD